MTNQDDLFRDKFRTQDETLTGLVSYWLTMPKALWYIAEVADALTALVMPTNWEQIGTVTVDEAVNAASLMLRSFQPMIGLIFPVALATLPANMLSCDGATHLRVDYPNLYDVLDSAYIVDADHFTVPDLRDRVIVGAGAAYAVNDMFGEASHTLTVAEMPSHAHPYTAPLLTGTATPPPLDTALPNPIAASTGATGGDGAHENRQPSLALNYGIVAL